MERRPVGEELGAALGRALQREFGTPERRAFWGGYAAALVVAARMGARPLLAVLLAELGGAATMRAWRAAADLSELAAAARKAAADAEV